MSTLISEDIRTRVGEAARQGKLTVQRCGSCGRWVWFPRAVCPHCFEDALEWSTASGYGTVITFSIVHKPQQQEYLTHVPIVFALVRLDEDCEMAATLIGDDRTSVGIGDRVRLAPEGWSRLPQFQLER